MTNDKNSYFNRAHRLGRIGTIIAILFMITQKFYQEAMSGAVKG